MAETPATPSRTTRKIMVAAVLAGCATLIAYLTVAGDPANSLHQSALAWAFTLAGAMLGGYLFGATWEIVKGGK